MGKAVGQGLVVIKNKRLINIALNSKMSKNAHAPK